MMPISGQASGSEDWSSRDQDEPQLNREAERLHEPSVLEAPPFDTRLTLWYLQNIL